MKVVFDTNILCADYRLVGGAFRVLLESLPRVGVSCYVPAVVHDEVLAVHRRQLEEAARTIRQVSQSWRRLTGEPLSFTLKPSDLDALAELYSQRLAQEFERRDITVLPYPDVAHRKLVERALTRRRPFDDKGSGYRDSLIWETILALAMSEGGPIALLTNNSKDFGTAPNIHPDLAADLTGEAVVELFNTLEEFNAKRIIPHLEHLEVAREELEADTNPKFSLRHWFSRNLQDMLNGSEDGAPFVGVTPGHGSVWVSEIMGLGRILIDDVRRLPSGDLLVLANVDVNLEVSVSATDDDCERYEDIYNFFGGDCYGSPSAFVQESGNVAVTLALKDTPREVVWCEIDEIRGLYVMEINPHPRRAT